MQVEEIKSFLDEKVLQYNHPDFIITDPISIPHLYTNKQDIEISAFLMATIAWGKRSSIISSGVKMLEMLRNEPYEFIMNEDIDSIPDCVVYRTFNSLDLKYILKGLRNVYRIHGGLEKVFSDGFKFGGCKEALVHFRNVFVEIGNPGRTGKHLANVSRESSAKRINMFLRWMVRKDNVGIDFGLWNEIDQSRLMLPLDLHTGNVSRKLGILTRKQNDWKAVEEVTEVLREFDKDDPVKYDFALFGLGVFEGFR